MVYAIHVERLEAQVRTDQQIAAVMVAAGAREVTMPSLPDALADLDEALNAPLAADVPTTERRLRESLGLRVA